MNKYLFFWLVLCLIIYMVIMSSCGQRHWSKRGERKGWITTKIDTIITEEVSTDTVFKHRVLRDTVVLHKDKLTVKYFYNNSDSTVYISGNCDEEKLLVPRNTIHIVEGESFLKKNWFPILCVLLILFIMWWKK